MMTLTEQKIDELIKQIKKYVQKNVSKSRYEHSLRTAEMCSKLCSLYKLDENLGYLMGISHDMCKNVDADTMLELTKLDGEPVSEIEMEKPGLLHGRAAAVLLERDFDFHDQRIIEAVANHTFGKVSMGDYAKVLFVADKVEPGREHITSDYLKELFKLSINRACEKVLQENIDFLNKKGRKIAPESIRLLNWLKSLD